MLFKLYGTQGVLGVQDYATYDPGTGVQHYAIPVGEYLTGNITRLVLANDDDANDDDRLMRFDPDPLDRLLCVLP